MAPCLPGYDGVYGSPAIPHDEEELGVGEQLGEVSGVQQGKGVLVAQPRGEVPMVDDHFQTQRSHGRL